MHSMSVSVGSAFRTAYWQRVLGEPASYEAARFAIGRLLGLVYLAAFASLTLELQPLLGARGLLPVGLFLSHARASLGPEAYWRVPTLFWLGGGLGAASSGPSALDSSMQAAAAIGVLLSVAALCGVTNAALWFCLWALYGSFVHVGQIFYSYGWELQLLETGMLAVFLSPWKTIGPLEGKPAPRIVIWLFRWLVFRVMLGSALIKLRNDPCWRDLTCLDFHFETQPNPNPLSFYLHHAPRAAHAAGVAFTLFVELVVPWFAFALRPLRHAAGVLLVLLQVALILSGNLSFLNWLTIVPALACFDDTAFPRLAGWIRTRRLGLQASARETVPNWALRAYVAVVGLLSVPVAINLASSDQQMNASYEPLGLVSTYGAFGSVDRARYEVVLEGSDDPDGDPGTYREYELPCMPGAVARRPCVLAPMQLRLDWQMWFVGSGAARGESIEQEPWLVHLLWQLLRGEPSALRLLSYNPFPRTPPRFVRLSLYRYRFAEASGRGVWWTRQRMDDGAPPLSLSHPGLRAYVRAAGWPDAQPPD